MVRHLAPLRHDACPMAVALKEGRSVRGAEAIAERPDGSRFWFTPFPTPIRNAAGDIVGGTMSNVFVVRAGRVSTPNVDRSGVAGVMRSMVLRECAALGIGAT
jgi:hypothetical protein